VQHLMLEGPSHLSRHNVTILQVLSAQKLATARTSELPLGKFFVRHVELGLQTRSNSSTRNQEADSLQALHQTTLQDHL
jgi:hypothetical protein